MMSSTTRSGRWVVQPRLGARAVAGLVDDEAVALQVRSRRPRAPSARRRRRAPSARPDRRGAVTLVTVRPRRAGPSRPRSRVSRSVSRTRAHARDGAGVPSRHGRRHGGSPDGAPSASPPPAAARTSRRVDGRHRRRRRRRRRPRRRASSSAGSPASQPSLITAVGTQFIDRFAASLKDLAIPLFGTNDKAALVTGIVDRLASPSAPRSARRRCGGRWSASSGSSRSARRPVLVPRRPARLDAPPASSPPCCRPRPASARCSGCCACCALGRTRRSAAPADAGVVAPAVPRSPPARWPCSPPAPPCSGGASAAATSSSRRASRPTCRRRPVDGPGAGAGRTDSRRARAVDVHHAERRLLPHRHRAGRPAGRRRRLEAEDRRRSSTTRSRASPSTSSSRWPTSRTR